MKKIQNCCTPVQAARLYEAIKAAGLEWPAIDWEFFASKRTATIWTKAEMEDYCKSCPDAAHTVFIPCPTFAELHVLGGCWFIGELETQMSGLIYLLQNEPGTASYAWAKLKEENR